jgi:hypothetical protein
VTKHIFFCLFILGISLNLVAQGTGTIRGTVYEKASGEPILFTNVLVKELGSGASTDVNGVFQIGQVNPGEYTLEVSNVEYETFSIKVTVTAGRVTTQNIFLKTGKVLEDFTLNGTKVEDKENVKISTIKADKKSISAVVATGGEPDLATYFQTVPGVVTTGDQGGQMYIRGGSPVQNKVLLEGLVIYNPFHSIGFFSVFDTELIKNAEIYTGGFGAEYGGRISSVMDVSYIDGNKKQLGGKVSVNPFGAKLTLEGPIKKLKDDASSGTISYILSAKTSYLEQSSKLLYNYVSEEGLPFNYTDVFGKVTFGSPSGSKFNMFGYNFRDKVKWQQISNLNWNSYGGGANFVILPTGAPVQIGGKFGYSKYDISLSDVIRDTSNIIIGQDTTKRSGISNFNLGFDFKYFLKSDEIKYGIEVSGFNTQFSLKNSVGRVVNQDNNTTEIGAYFDYRINRGIMVVNPSFRAQYYAALGNFSPEPRLGLKINASDKFRIKAAGGVYSQNVIAANSDRDVVNLFYGFLSGPDNLQDEIIQPDGSVKDRKHALQKATHAIVGFEQDLGKKISLNVEGYYKWFTQLTNINRNKIYDDNGSNSDKPDVLKKDFIIETGSAKGIDVVTKYSTDRLYVWFVYSLGKVDRWNGVNATYSPIFDRRHNINLVTTYFIDKDHNWEVDFRWNFGSGLPFTQTQGYYQNIDFAQGIGTDITTSNTDDLSIIYGDLNSGRLPAYHRLDVSIKRTINLSDKSKMEINASVTNAYSRQNVFYVDRITNVRVNQLPILPSIGFNWKF